MLGYAHFEIANPTWYESLRSFWNAVIWKATLHLFFLHSNYGAFLSLICLQPGSLLFLSPQPSCGPPSIRCSDHLLWVEDHPLVHMVTVHATVANCPSIEVWVHSRDHRTYVQFLAIPVGSFTSRQVCLSCQRGVPSNVASEPLLMHKPAASPRHCEPVQYRHISATQRESCEDWTPVYQVQSPACYRCATETDNIYELIVNTSQRSGLQKILYISTELKIRLKSSHLTFGTYFLHNNKLHQESVTMATKTDTCTQFLFSPILCFVY